MYLYAESATLYSCATFGLYKLNLIRTFGSASYQLSLHLLHWHENGLRLRSTVPLFTTGARLFEGHFPNLLRTEEDRHCRKIIHSTGFDRGCRPAED